ncbi:MAG: 2-polyprenylphenol 6-hydroxylase [Thermodesulfobacteriota bacterium]
MLNKYRNFKRIQRIFSVLIRYGFGGLVSELKILPYFSTIQKLLFFRRRGRGLSIPVRIRLVLEELGPSFVKLGQIASTRADVLPYEWIEEFKKLQDMVPAEPFDKVKRVIEKSLKAPITEKFATFEEKPVASASIAQVHLATLHDGTEVAVKVRRPNIENIIEADISVMQILADLAARYIPTARRYQPVAVVEEFARIIHREQDMNIEAANINLFRKLFKDEDRLQIPEVYWEHTSTEVLTMERIYGTPMDEIEKIQKLGLDVRQVAHDGIEIFFKQVFEHGIFHADLHPGNIFVRDDGVIIYLDFGIVGRLDRNLKKYLASLLYYLIKEDYYKMAVIHKDMGLIHKNVDIAEFEAALRDMSEPLIGRDLEHINMSTLLMQLFETAKKFDMVLQPNLLLLQKSTVIIEGVGRQLYPDINIFEVARPLIARWMIKERFSPKVVAGRKREELGDILDSITTLPALAGDFFDKAANEELKIGFVHHGLEGYTEEIKHAGKRIAWGALAAASVLGASILTAFSPEAAWRFLEIPALGWAGYILSIIFTIKVWSGR